MITIVADPDVPPGMVVLKQGERIVGAWCRGVVFGTEDVERLADKVVEQMRARWAR